MDRSLFTSLSLSLLGCGASSQNAMNCSKVSSIAVDGSVVEKSMRAGKLPPGWGGVLDLIEEANGSENPKRYRCTVHMDVAKGATGTSPDPHRLAFWTAEHCLKFDKARSAELNIFDPSKKRFVRFPVRLDELDRFTAGKKLFEQHLNQRVAEYVEAAGRPSRGLIERGIPACKVDTQLFMNQNPNLGVVCSSVLDLARLEGRVHESAASRTDVYELLSRMHTDIQVQEKKQLDSIQAFAQFISATQLNDMKFWLENWRPKISQLTQWRRYEGFSLLIEEIRSTCTAENVMGVCHPDIRAFFADALDEYKLANTVATYQDFLKAKVNAPQDGKTFNLPWILHSQKSVENLLPLTGAATLGTNFEIPSSKGTVRVTQSDTLGTKGPLYYSAVPISDLRSTAVESLKTNMKFNAKTLLYSYDKGLQQGESFLMQPGDSGSVILVGNTPIGVVSTVNGVETSGGAAVMPLPEYAEEPEDVPQAKATKKRETAVNCK
jgi:hypothetical protein